MSFIDGIRHQVRTWADPGVHQRELEEEVRLHLELDAVQQSARRASDGRANARRRFGNPTYLIEETRHVARLSLFDSLTQDTRHLVRSLRRSRGFSVVAIATLALGIGATTAILSIVDHVLVHSLPYRDAGRVMALFERDEQGNFRTPSYPTVKDWQADAAVHEAFDEVSFVRGDGVTLLGPDGPERLLTGFADQSFFPVLGATPVLGRALIADDQRAGAPPVVVLSYALWQHRFGGDPAIVGKRLSLDSVPTTVVGVMGVGAQYPTFASMWQPISQYMNIVPLTRRGLHADSRTIGRLRAGVDSARAVTLMRVVGTRLAAAYPVEQAHWGMAMTPVRDEIIGNVQPMLVTLGAAAGVILLLACANVANLLLARMSTRTRELAVRSAIGASRKRLVGQLLTESMVLAASGGVIGTAVAAVAVGLARKLPASRLPRVDEVAVDGRVLAIAAGASLLTVLLCGVWPALRATRPTSGAVLRSGALSGGGRSDSRLRRALVTVQFGLALILLVGAGLLLQSFRRAANVGVGFDPRGLVTVAISPTMDGYRTPSQAAALYARIMESVRGVPGVSDAAFINHFPFTGSSIPTSVEVEGRSGPDSSANQVLYRTVSDGYLRTMRMSLVGGRWFNSDDIRSPGGSFVINQTMARHYWPGESAVGKRLTARRASQARADFGQPIAGTVIGVVADVSQFSQDIVPSPELYVPYTLEVWPWATLVVRSRDGAHSILALKRAILDVEPRLLLNDGDPGRGFSLTEDLIARSLEQRRFAVTLVVLFAGCALVLAAIGMYGVIAYGITQRTREIGVRKALGATDAMIAALIFRESFALAASGVVLGCLGAWASARLIRGLLFDTGPADPMTYVLTILVLTAAAALATLLPARRATRLDPTIAMRGE